MAAQHPDQVPFLIFANSKGEILDYDSLLMAGKSGSFINTPRPDELIKLPEGSELFNLPQRHPIGIDPVTGEKNILKNNPYNQKETVYAVAAFMAPAYTAIFNAAYRSNDNVEPLPLFAYTAVGWYKGDFWVTAFRSDSNPRQDPSQFNHRIINRNTKKRLSKYSDNRLIQHLGKCCLTYGCPAARNYFLDRWEAPLPTSPSCNASCIGCISLQPSGCCPSTQDRIKFIPRPDEIVEIAVPHLASAPNAVVSFGQGCEGEPLLQSNTIEKSIRIIRRNTEKGTINLNTNGSLPEKVEQLAVAGLDSIRISMNSARPKYYNHYYRPTNYKFDDVIQSMKVMKKYGKFISINYFILPGFTDDPDEFEAMSKLIESIQPNLIQLRNLNMDPDYYFRAIHHSHTSKPLGIDKWLGKLKQSFPALNFGYFNPAIR